MQRRTFIAETGSIAAASVALAGCTGSTDDSVEGGTSPEPDSRESGTEEPAGEDPTESEPTAEEPEGDLVILEHDWEVVNEYDSDAVEDDYAVVGLARNDLDVAVDVYGECRFYDQDGVQFEDTNHSSRGVQPGDTFRFEFRLLGDYTPDDVDHYEFDLRAREA